jgi:lactoylglutathione lyase
MMPNWRELKPSIVFACDDFEKTYMELKSKGIFKSEDIGL